jgi:hypothetical protein
MASAPHPHNQVARSARGYIMGAIEPTARRVCMIGVALLVLTGLVARREHAPAKTSDARFVTAPCDLRSLAPSCDAGWRVQVDPETGRYSMPASDASAATATDGARARELAVEPGTSAAGGYVIRLDGAPGSPQEQH